MSSDKRTILIAIGIFAALVLLAEARFLPYSSSVLYDTRFLSPGVDNRAHEVDFARGEMLKRAVMELLGVGESGSDWVGGAFNIFPHLLIALMMAVLPPILACNLAALLVWVANGLGVFLLARKVGASPTGAIAAGCMFCLSPTLWMTMSMDNLSFGALFWVPMLLAALLRAREPGGHGAAAAASVLILGLALSNFYYLAMTAVFGAVVLAETAVLGGKAGAAGTGTASSRRRALLGLLLAVAGGALLLLPLARAELAAMATGGGAYDPVFSIRESSGFESAQHALNELHVSSTWFLAVALVALASFLPWERRSGLREPGVVALAVLVGLALIAGMGFVQQADREVLAGLPVIWRMRLFAKMSDCALPLVCALAGRGFTALTRPSWHRLVRPMVLGLLLAGAATLAFMTGWERSLWTTTAPQFLIPEAVVEQARRAARTHRGLLLVVPYRIRHLTRLYFSLHLGRELQAEWESPRCVAIGDLLGHEEAPSAYAAAAELAGFQAEQPRRCDLVVARLGDGGLHPAGRDPMARIRGLGLRVLWSDGRWFTARHAGCGGL